MSQCLEVSEALRIPRSSATHSLLLPLSPEMTGKESCIPPNPKSPFHPKSRSQRRVLTRALDIAREAVELDGIGEDYEATVKAYGRSLALLGEFMEILRKESLLPLTEGQESERSQVQHIHDSYKARMNALIQIYSIPLVPYVIPHPEL
ncbi:hypothetical protein DL96DRAFT_1824734 [Flagelloscypha sp. PMI_526]|nr:hypothetical protein DL96DRAFT_1824734 [Flagelloscypha sp. PMI_526]